MKKFIKIELFIEETECEDCGNYTMECCKITSSKKSLNTTLGSAHCCSLEKAEILDAIIYLDEKLNLELPFSDEAKAIMDKHNFSLRETVENYLFDFVDEEGYDCYIEIFDLSKYNDCVIEMLKQLLSKKGFELIFVNNTKNHFSGNFSVS